MTLPFILLGLLYIIGLVVVISIAILLAHRGKLDSTNKGILTFLWIISPILVCFAICLSVRFVIFWARLSKVGKPRKKVNVWEVLKD